VSVAVLLIAVGGGLFVARHRVTRKLEHALERVGLAADTPSPATAKPRGPQGTLDVAALRLGAHPRILLTQERLGALALHREPSTTVWKSLIDACQKARGEKIASGYEAWDWANAALELALCAKVTHDTTYRDAGLRYFQALLDDKTAVGDGQGGDLIVRHDDGYSIRTHGWLGAIAYDWLSDAPGMTPALKKKAMDRFIAWTSWFREKGYNRDQPISNYYMGYFGAVAFAGLACSGEDPRARDLSVQAARMWNSEIVPTFGSKLEGGDFPEGWQYGDLVGTVLALYLDAANTARAPGAKSIAGDLPWLSETIPLREHALLPDSKHTYDNGDWSQKPALAPAEMLSALAVVLGDDQVGKGHKAAYLAQLARRTGKGEWKWLEALAPDPDPPLSDTSKGPLSYLAKGTATVFARTSFASGGIWFAFSSAPSLSDHQHLDAGHFELVRAEDPLIIDSGDYAAYSSLSHNVIIVDDPLQSSNPEEAAKTHPIITYKGNQSPWSDSAHIARFEDAGPYVYALADYASAYNPAGYPKERSDRAVSRAEREIFFSRRPGPDNVAAMIGGGPTGRVVIYDRLTLTNPRFTTTFILHGGGAPLIEGKRATFKTGRSVAWATTLGPEGAVSRVVDETHNTYSPDKAFFTNKPPDGVTSFRYEVASPASPATTERRFLHEIGSGNSGEMPTSRVAISGDRATGVVVNGEAYVFVKDGQDTRPTALSYRVPPHTWFHTIADLVPASEYAVTAVPDGADCKVTLTPGSGKKTSSAGVLALDFGECVLR
jgi:hypothetical protein